MVTVCAASSGAWKTELVLISDLATLTKQITAYVVRALDADAQREEPTSPAEEQRLGSRLVDLGTELQARAGHSSASARCTPSPEHPARSLTARQRPHDTPPPWANPQSAIYEP